MDKTTKVTIVFGSIAIVLTMLFTLLIFLFQPGNYFNIRNFDECQQAGFPVQESYPMTCKDFFGHSYTSPDTVNAENTDTTTSTDSNIPQEPQEEKVDSYSDCTQQGGEIEIIDGKATCKTKEEETIEVDTGNQFDLEEEIYISQPSIDSYVKDKLELFGSAMKNWYSNNAVSFKITSEDGKTTYISGICESKETVTDDIMYQFSCSKTITNPVTAKAKLVIINPDKTKEDLNIPINLTEY